MSTSYEPNPPARKNEDFPQTNTIPGGWSMDELMDAYNGAGERADHIRAEEALRSSEAMRSAAPVPVPATGGHTNGKTNGRTHETPAAQPTSSETESPFARQLEPFPTDAQLPGMWL